MSNIKWLTLFTPYWAEAILKARDVRIGIKYS